MTFWAYLGSIGICFHEVILCLKIFMQAEKLFCLAM